MKWLFLLVASFYSFASFGQSYLGRITKNVNLREGSGIEFGIIRNLTKGSMVFIESLEPENGFYKVIYIKSDEEGYVSTKFVTIGKEVQRNEGGMFTPAGSINDINPEAEIFNDTRLRLTVKLNGEAYYFAPHEKRTITLTPGTYEYRASAPGVIPAIGTDEAAANMSYTWRFYVTTVYR